MRYHSSRRKTVRRIAPCTIVKTVRDNYNTRWNDDEVLTHHLPNTSPTPPPAFGSTFTTLSVAIPTTNSGNIVLQQLPLLRLPNARTASLDTKIVRGVSGGKLTLYQQWKRVFCVRRYLVGSAAKRVTQSSIMRKLPLLLDIFIAST